MTLLTTLTSNLAAEAGEMQPSPIPLPTPSPAPEPPLTQPTPLPKHPSTEFLRERVDSYLPDFGDGAEFFADAEDLQEACMGTALPVYPAVDTERIILTDPAPKDACMAEVLMGK